MSKEFYRGELLRGTYTNDYTRKQWHGDRRKHGSNKERQRKLLDIKLA